MTKVSDAAFKDATIDLETIDITRLISLPYTDLGNARRFHERFGADLRWSEIRGRWLAWDGTHWEWDERRIAHQRAQETVERIAEEVVHLEKRMKETKDDERRKLASEWLEAAKKHARSSQGSERINAIPSQARAMPDSSVAMADLDTDPWLLTVQNGTLHLRTGGLAPHNRADLITRIAPVIYDQNAVAPRWTAFIEEVFPDVAVRGLAQRSLGYSLTGCVRDQSWFLMQGGGSNGKSTLAETIKFVLGGYATTLPAGLLEQQPYERHPTELTGLQGARFAAGAEPRKGKRWDAEKIKALTGGDSIEARFMRGDFFVFSPTHKLWVGCNDLPATDDLGHGFWRRVVIIPFESTFRRPEDPGTGPKLDPTLPATLRKEASGILNWLLEGLAAWRTDGLQVPEKCVKAAQEYRAEHDTIGRFIEERCDVGGGFSCSSSELYHAYRNWHEMQGLDGSPVSNISFGKRLQNVTGIASMKGAHGSRRWSGIKLASTDQGASDTEDDSGGG